jgi:hypothetical protein
LSREPGRAGGVEIAGALIDATDRLANALDTLLSEIRRQLSKAYANENPAAIAPL